MNKHTQGPWSIEKTEWEEYWKPEVHYNVGPACAINKEADALLIAAAPELLEALQDAADALAILQPDSWVLTQALAAISKATGEHHE